MINSINLNHLPIQDLVISGLIIFIMSTVIANLYNPLLGIIYALGNILSLLATYIVNLKYSSKLKIQK